MMGLELPGVTLIETPAEARAKARGWRRMAREVNTPDAPEEAKAKARELNQRAEAAERWARTQEDALVAGHQAAAVHEAKVVPIGGRKPLLSDEGRRRLAAGHGPYAHGPRAAAHEAYERARPPALRIAHNGRQHFFQGLEQPFGPVADTGELLMEMLGLSLAVVLIADLLRAPGAIASTSQHTLGFFSRAIDVVDPFTGLRPAGVAAPRTAPARAATRSHVTVAGTTRPVPQAKSPTA